MKETILKFWFENLFNEDEPILSVSTGDCLLLEIKVRKGSSRIVTNLWKEGRHVNEVTNLLLVDGLNIFRFSEDGEKICLNSINGSECFFSWTSSAQIELFSFDINKWEEENDYS